MKNTTQILEEIKQLDAVEVMIIGGDFAKRYPNSSHSKLIIDYFNSKIIVPFFDVQMALASLIFETQK